VIRERRKPRGANSLGAKGEDGIFVCNRPPFTEGRKEKIILTRTNQPGIFDTSV
jgi:hypothetical protein